MKIRVDNDLVFELSETKKKVLCYDIYEDELLDDIKRRLEYIIMHKYEECFKRLKLEWDPQFEAMGMEALPTNADKYAELVFRQKEYRGRALRDPKLL
jgi:hypothetical protein